MTKVRRITVPALLLLFLVSCLAPSRTVDRPLSVGEMIDLGRSDSRVMAHLDHLVNKIGPRLTGSDNLTKACEWARDEFRHMGLEARMEEWGTMPVGFNRGPSKGRMIAPMVKALHFGTNAWTPGTKGAVAGPAVLAPAAEDEFTVLKPKLKGAWVVIPKRPDGELQKKLDGLFDEAGIAGIIHGSKSELIVTSGKHRITWENRPTRVSITLVQSEHKEIVNLLKEGKEVRLEFDIRNEFKPGPVKVYNVVADLRGTEKPEELVIVGGHIDSWDGATGATDNATGCATAMEAARILTMSNIKPKRTIRFILWSGEEQGILGSWGYVKAHPKEMPKISAVFVHDGGTNYISGLQCTAASAPIFEKIFAPIQSLDPDKSFDIGVVEELASGGSDHAAYLSAGVPGYFWNQSGRANYNRTHHTQHDRYDAVIPEYQVHSAVVVAVAARGVADLDRLLPRDGISASGGAHGHGGRRLGINLEEDSLEISEVHERTPAEKAGLKPGDVILKLGGRAVSDLDEMLAAMKAADLTTTVVIRRAGQELSISVTFDK